jgi:hypothetical protein
MTPIEELKDVIFKLQGVQATHRQSVPVKEVFNDTVCADKGKSVRKAPGTRSCCPALPAT